METNVNYTAVGAFVLVLFAIICIGVIWLARGLSFTHFSTYAIYMEESVSGLNVDAPVEFNGVSVGTVTNVSISKRNPRLVKLFITIKDGTPITQGTVATVSSRGVTGIAYVALKDDGSNNGPLIIEPGQDYPVIKSAPSLFSRIDTGLEKINTSLYKISTAIESILDQQNQAAIKNTILNIDKFARMLSEESGKVSEIIDNTAKASRQFPNLLRSGQGAVQSFQTQTMPSVDRAVKNLDDVSENLLEMSNDLKQNPSMLIRGKAPAPLGPGE